jgi:predicted dehydrogenase
MNDTIRWGILGTGKIARQFAAGLKHLSDATLIAVGSRRADSANAFGEQFAVAHRHASYEALVRDPDVDAIYVATPHSCHLENTLLALTAGKAVLCEKPFTINAREAEQAVAFARVKKLFLMEAMWTRCFPLMEKLRELLAGKTIGEVRMLTADFGFRAEYHEEERLFNPVTSGGALLDVGVYPISLASMIFGAPTRIASHAQLGPTGVDEEAAIILSHAQGQLAVLSTAIRLETPQEAIIMGTAGRIRVHSPWWRPTAMTISREGRSDELMEFPFAGNGYQFEAAEFMGCLRTGKLESRLMPLDETLSIMRTLDAIRAQWGLRYPIDQLI